jgi:hypothetical protein
MNSTETTATPLAWMPDHARVWVFASPRPLAPAEAELLADRVSDFVSRWHAHGHPVVGGWGVEHDRFLLIAADEEATGVSGCSLDSMYDSLKALERELGVSLLDASSRVWFRDADGEIRALTRPEFRALARSGEVGPETIVFDNTAPTLAAVRAGAWERKMKDSWQGKAFLGGDR